MTGICNDFCSKRRHCQCLQVKTKALPIPSGQNEGIANAFRSRWRQGKFPLPNLFMSKQEEQCKYNPTITYKVGLNFSIQSWNKKNQRSHSCCSQVKLSLWHIFVDQAVSFFQIGMKTKIKTKKFGCLFLVTGWYNETNISSMKSAPWAKFTTDMHPPNRTCSARDLQHLTLF